VLPGATTRVPIWDELPCNVKTGFVRRELNSLDLHSQRQSGRRAIVCPYGIDVGKTAYDTDASPGKSHADDRAAAR